MRKKKLSHEGDPEIKAISSILDALRELEGESIQRVLDYVHERLSLGRSLSIATRQPSNLAATESLPVEVVSAHGRKTSIRDLKEEKKPSSANQMAALIAYYLSEIADISERKEAINSADLQKYFKQAGFRLPKVIHVALPNAAAAGYFDSMGNGLYRLNPVGYNLIAHGLPRGLDTPSQRKHRSTKPKNAK